MLRKSLERLICVAAMLVTALAITSPAQARQDSPAGASVIVNGRNVMSVSLGQDGNSTGELRKAEGTRWVELDATGQPVYQLQEVKRDEWSVYLVDRARGISLQLDLRARKATFKEYGATRPRDVAEIQAASSVATQAQASIPVAPQKPAAAPAKAPAKPAAKDSSPTFCWTDTVTRGPGIIPGRVADCPPGFTNDGATCKREADTIAAPSRAADCPAGYNAAGGACERPALTKPNSNSRLADCPDGFTNSGAECFRLSAPNPLGMDVMTCKGGEAKVGGRCYRGCETGFNAAGTSCTRPVSTLGSDKMACKAGFKKTGNGQRCVAECASGYNNTGEACVRTAQTLGLESMSCKAGETRNGGRCVSVAATCGAGEVQQGGLCYTACAAGFDGVGSACFGQAPKTWAQCGMGAAKTSQACGAIVLDQMTSVKQAAVFVGLLGSAEPVSGAAPRTAQLAATQKKFKEMLDAYGRAKELPLFKKGLGAWESANAGKNAQAVSLDNMAAATTDVDMVRYATHLLAIVDLSGASTDAATYPKCSKLPPSK
jgi:hypothetical protein